MFHATSTTVLGHVMDEVSAIVGGLVGGARYGAKVRLPHAMIMTLLFRNDLDAKEKIRNISKLVLEHASNLAAFAAVYKSILAVFKWSSRYLQQHPQHRNNDDDDAQRSLGRLFLRLIVDGPFSLSETQRLPASMAGHPERPYHSLVAGGVGGYLVWGRYSSINHQVVLYLTSRILVGLTKRAWEHFHGTPHSHPTSLLQHPKTYPILAAAVWGIVMVLFEESPHVLHRSLKASMDEIYRFQLSSLAQRSSSSSSSSMVSQGEV